MGCDFLEDSVFDRYYNSQLKLKLQLQNLHVFVCSEYIILLLYLVFSGYIYYFFYPVRCIFLFLKMDKEQSSYNSYSLSSLQQKREKHNTRNILVNKSREKSN